jgi:hypothetical protein
MSFGRLVAPRTSIRDVEESRPSQSLYTLFEKYLKGESMYLRHELRFHPCSRFVIHITSFSQERVDLVNEYNAWLAFVS